ncbi:EamA family transporter [Pseudodesulfovibrio sp. JC047]|uniref:DMT family transporter n=1 Tax=Pseudodesulfovibrio sp. JC047 TaxID=2683199 RepID=UPI0013D5BF87|nr:DMT family transporter [Pseudodesulfovibrio sp. JC047]NDV18332.1 EamA family transporter [Pseudodesulfovibrio sp. JC047]
MTTATAKNASSATLDQLKMHQDVAFAKKGLIFAVFSGMSWGLNGVILSLAFGAAVFLNEEYWLLAPLTVGALHDTFSALWLLIFNASTGRLRELGRTLRSKSARPVIIGALFGGPIAMSSYMLGVKFAGPAYVMPITALYPAVASVFASIYLKEKICPRAWFGLVLCIVGGVIIGYTPPEGSLGTEFYLGIGFACIATFGWGTEGVLATSGMDLLDPAVALNVRQLTSSTVYLLVVLPLAGGHMLLVPGLMDSIGWVFPVAALTGAFSYVCWYRAMNMTGVSRAMAINITYSLWGIFFSAVFTDVEITANIIIGALVITTGMLLVVGNPKEMTSLRNVD